MSRPKARQASAAPFQGGAVPLDRNFRIVCHVSREGISFDGEADSLTGITGSIIDILLFSENDLSDCDVNGTLTIEGAIATPPGKVAGHLPAEMLDHLRFAVASAIPRVVQPVPSAETLDLSRFPSEFAPKLTLSFQPSAESIASSSEISIISHVSTYNSPMWQGGQQPTSEEQADSPLSPPASLSEPQTPAAALKSLAASLPQAYEQRATALADVSHAYRQELANQLAPALNARIQAMPHDTYEEKKELAKWVNEELRRFDLAIKCPKTGQPSILLVGPGNHPEFGRFIIEHRTPEGKRVRTVQTPELPQIELTEANPRREAIKEWRQRIEQNRQGGTAQR